MYECVFVQMTVVVVGSDFISVNLIKKKQLSFYGLKTKH